MYQMTDAAFAEARRYCIRHHTVVEDGCWFNGLYTRVVPSHAIELTAVFLDRKVAAILARRPNGTANQQQELAAIIHLCGAASAKAFARRGFHLIASERCGDHDVATYVAQVNAMKREFLRYGARHRVRAAFGKRACAGPGSVPERDRGFQSCFLRRGLFCSTELLDARNDVLRRPTSSVPVRGLNLQ
jgi:hypothetical protein